MLTGDTFKQLLELNMVVVCWLVMP